MPHGLFSALKVLYRHRARDDADAEFGVFGRKRNKTNASLANETKHTHVYTHRRTL